MIYEGIDRWNSPYLDHHGVKGMKWGVRKDKPSLSSRYSKWGRAVSNKSYDKMASRVEARRAKKMQEVDSSPFKNTRYGKWVKKVSNKSYDRERVDIEARRSKKMSEFDAFDKLTSTHVSAKQKRYDSSDYAKAKSLSNQELQQRINRINLEQSYISAMQRDRTAYRDATDGVLRKWGRKTVTGLYNTFVNSGSSMVDVGGQLTRNAVINSANKVAPVTRKPKK